MLEMDIRRGDKCVDTNLGRPAQSLPCPIHVFGASASEAANDRPFHLLRNPPDRFKVSRRAVRESRLDDVNVQARQLLRHYQFFFEIHRRPGRLFSISKRRIENTDHA